VNTLGETIVTCPNCGTPVSMAVRVASVRVDDNALLVELAHHRVTHKCREADR
jgi:hypothetical protein